MLQLMVQKMSLCIMLIDNIGNGYQLSFIEVSSEILSPWWSCHQMHWWLGAIRSRGVATWKIYISYIFLAFQDVLSPLIYQSTNKEYCEKVCKSRSSFIFLTGISRVECIEIRRPVCIALFTSGILKRCITMQNLPFYALS